MAKDKAVDSAVLDGYFSDIANAIRGKNGESGTYTPAQMPAKITAIPSGGGDNLPARVDGTCTSVTNDTATTVKYYAFYECSLLESVSLASATDIGNYSFYNCSKLKSLSIPSATFIGQYAFYNTGADISAADSIILNLSNVTEMGRNVFNNSKLIKEVIFGKDIAYNKLASGIFLGCTNLQSVIFEKNIVNVTASLFSGCSNCTLYDFSNCTGVPTLSNANSFTGINANAKIVVPDSLYNTWIAASNWSNYASYIIKKSDYDAL